MQRRIIPWRTRRQHPHEHPLAPVLMLIVHPRDVLSGSSADSRQGKVQRAVSSGVIDVVQLRSTRDDSEAAVLDAGRVIHEILHAENQCQTLLENQHGDAADNTHHQPPMRPAFVVNHPSLEIVAQIRPQGWHWKEHVLLAQDSTASRQERIRQARQLDPALLVGCSVHSVHAAELATEAGVDYLQVGTMFSTLSHPEKTAMDLEGPTLLRAIDQALSATASVQVPRPRLLAVGGIDHEQHVEQVLDHGGEGIAVIRGILAASDPVAAARRYRKWMEGRRSQIEPL